MKILHIHDQAGVACTIAKYQKRLGHTVNVIKSKSSDQMRFLEFYGFEATELKGAEFDDYAVDLAKDYDIIHCHSVHEIATTIKTLYPSKKVFIHYHGSDLRTNPINTYCNDMVDGVFYATPDLKNYLPERAAYIPTIVDTELFYPSEIGDGIFNNILPKLDYSETPSYYRRFGTFNDMKIVLGKQMTELSKTALECLALGLTVIDWNDCIHKGLPEQHKPNNVVNLLEKYYG